MGCERGQPGRDDTVDDIWRREGKQYLARGSGMRRYESVQESLSVHAFGEPIGTWLQCQDFEPRSMPSRTSRRVARDSSSQHRQRPHHGLGG